MLDSMLVGDQHLTRRDPATYFTVGQINPERGFVHVFDDTTLGIVLKTLDTVSDFVAYLRKKELLFARVRGLIATGEEDLLAYYLTNLNSSGEHDFNVPKGVSALFIPEGALGYFLPPPAAIGSS
jgi:hypothetical protein